MTSDLNVRLKPDCTEGGLAASVDQLEQVPLVSRSLQLVIVLLAAIAIAATGSHILVDWLKIRTAAVTRFDYGAAKGRSMTYLAGSSLAGQALDWTRLPQELDREIIGWGIAGGSPFEWEIFQPRAGNVGTSFIAVSSYDLDEAIFCDFSAEVVPIGHTINALRGIHASWSYSRRALSQYPTSWLRLLFPSLGRSRGIMGQLHTKVAQLLPADGAIGLEAGPVLSLGQEAVGDPSRGGRISNWSDAERLRKLTAMSSGFQGSHSFEGLKHHALQRMLEYGKKRGDVTAIVLPVSPTYSNAFITAKLNEQFESSLMEVQHNVPGVRWIRLDQLDALKSDDNYYDLVHMNSEGQQLTTGLFLSLLNGSGNRE
jgi:hypothetical protein